MRSIHGLWPLLLILLAGCPEPAPEPGDDDDATDDDDAAGDDDDSTDDDDASGDDDDASGDDDDSAPAEIASLALEPASLLLDASGDTGTFAVLAYDADGDVIEGLEATWASGDVEVSVDDAGEVTAQIDVGSGVITATVGDRSISGLVVIAPLVDEHVLLTDDQLGVGEAVDEDAEFGPGFQFELQVSDATAPDPGTIVVGTGDIPLAARFVSANGSIWLLEVPTLADVFDDFQIDVTVDAATLPLEIPADVAAAYDITEDDGVLSYVPLGDAERGDDGPCETSGSMGGASIQYPEFSFDRNFEVEFSAGTEDPFKLVATASLSATLEAGVSFSASAEGSIECTFELGAIPLPAPGPLVFFARPELAFGAGVAADGSIFLGSAELSASATIGSDVALGLDCTDGCDWVTDLDPSLGVELDVTAEVVFDPQIQASLQAYGWLRPQVTAHLLTIDLFTVELLMVKLGLRDVMDLKTVTGQATDPAYTSSEQLEPYVNVTSPAYESAAEALETLDITLPALEFDFAADPPAESPKPPEAGALTADTDLLVEGEEVTFTVHLDPATVYWLGFYNVGEVTVYGVTDDGVEELDSADAADGETTIEVPWTPTAAHVDDPPQPFAFVEPAVWPFLPGLEFELGPGDVSFTAGAFESCEDVADAELEDGAYTISPPGYPSFEADCEDGWTILDSDFLVSHASWFNTTLFVNGNGAVFNPAIHSGWTSDGFWITPQRPVGDVDGYTQCIRTRFTAPWTVHQVTGEFTADTYLVGGADDTSTTGAWGAPDFWGRGSLMFGWEYSATDLQTIKDQSTWGANYNNSPTTYAIPETTATDVGSILTWEHCDDGLGGEDLLVRDIELWIKTQP